MTNIKLFLQNNYTDERLAMLLAHVQDGKLSFYSCCCFIGVTNSPHALRDHVPGFGLKPMPDGSYFHDQEVRHSSPIALAAEAEYRELGKTDAERREMVLPLILAEMERRAVKTQEKEVLYEFRA